MYQLIITARSMPVVTVEQQCAFSRIDVPQSSPISEDYLLFETFIDAATDQVETIAAVATTNQTVFETYDIFPDQQDPRLMYDYQLSYAYNWTPWWWFGFPAVDSIELTRRPVFSSDSPVTLPLVEYMDINGNLQTFDPSNYTVFADKITLNPNCNWPLTDRRKDCVQITYGAGYGEDASSVPSRLSLAIMFLAGHFIDTRSIASIDPTVEIYQTLSALLSSYRLLRIPR